MKKLLLTLLFAVFTSATFAQILLKPGIRAGVNMSSVSNYPTLDTRTGFYAGLVLEMKFSDVYAIQPEVYYSQQGGKGTNGYEDLKVNYISISFANKFYVLQGTGLHLILGPSIDSNCNNNMVNALNNDADFDTTPFDISAFGGIGYDFPFGLSIEARYKQGFVDLDLDDQNIYYGDDGAQLNSSIQIGIAYKFKF